MRKAYLALLMLMLMSSCYDVSTKTMLVATGNPAYMIIKELAGTKIEVIRLVPPGASPHSYEPKPSQANQSQSANSLIFLADDIDGWAAKLPAKNKICLFDLLPAKHKVYADKLESSNESSNEANSNSNSRKKSKHSDHDGHSHTGNYDAHFWTDPLAVKELVPLLVDTLSKIDPDNATTYRNNGEIFIKRLDLLHKQMENILNSCRGKAVFLNHPSFRYLILRYGLVYGGTIEPQAGVEPSPKWVSKLIEEIKSAEAKAIFSEPQLNQKTPKMIANEAKVSLYELDPNGGSKGRESYSELMIYNAKMISKALK